MSTINSYRLCAQLEELGRLCRKIRNMIPEGAPILREKRLLTCCWKLGSEGGPDVSAKIVAPGLPNQHGRLLAEPLRQKIEARSAGVFAHLLRAMPALSIPGVALSLHLAPGPNDGAHYELTVDLGRLRCDVTPPPLASAELCLEKIESLASTLGDLPPWDGASIWIVQFRGHPRTVPAASNTSAVALLEGLAAHDC